MKVVRPLVILLMVASCGVAPSAPPRYKETRGARMGKIAVVLPIETGGDASDEAMEALYAKIVEELVYRGYDVLDRKDVDAFYTKNAIGIRASLKARYKPEEVAAGMGVKGVLYSNVTEWGRTVGVIRNEIIVRVEFFLMGADGKELWKDYSEQKLEFDAKLGGGSRKLHPWELQADAGGCGGISAHIEGPSIKDPTHGAASAVAKSLINSPDQLMPDVVMDAFYSLPHEGQ